MRSLEASPLVSVIVPTYKRADRLENALRSIKGQTYRNLEILVVNDNIPGSDWDCSTAETLKKFGDSRLKVVHTAGQTGGGAARNYACRYASGEYLAFLDDDDEFLPDKVETQLAFMLEHDLDMCWQDVSWYDESGKLVEHRRLDHCKDFTQQGLLRAHLLTPISPTSIYMLKKSLFDRTKGFGEVATGQDWWLMLRCIEAGACMGYMPEVHVRQYLHSGERLSLGKNKIDGEVARHEVVRSYYSRLSKKDVRYIEFRHNAVLAFAMKRSRQPRLAIHYAFKAVASSPVACISEALKFFGKAKS
jgi:glycosyltransferase involved in cell wall biosynthesis